MKIRPAERISGKLQLPGDKSISHRAAMLAAIAEGTSSLSNFSTSVDCASTLSCLGALGVLIDQDGNTIQIHGRKGRFAKPGAPLDCGNSGSTMRMLSGLLATQDFSSTLTGDDSLRSRPMSRIIQPLEMMGARILSDGGRAPLQIHGRSPLTAIRYEMPVASAQLKSCLLMAGLGAEGYTEVVEPLASRDHTERLLRWLSGPLKNIDTDQGQIHAVSGPSTLRARDVKVPGDFSSAAFFIAAAVMIARSELEIEHVGLNPTRTQFLDLLRSSDLRIEIINEREVCNEPRGTVVVRGKLHSQSFPRIEVGADSVPSLIDELPMLAVLGSQLGGVRISGASELRIKESDRIAATVSNLRAMGAVVTEFEDGLMVNGPVKLRGTSLYSFGDHRIAMAFAVAALAAEGESVINGSDCVEISFPGFFETLESVVER